LLSHLNVLQQFTGLELFVGRVIADFCHFGSRSFE
jgi:hypothetical protein